MLIFSDSFSRCCAAAILVLSACTPLPEWTRERQAEVTTRPFTNASPAQVAAAAEEVLRLADGRDVKFDYRPDGFRAVRDYGAYFVIGAVMGSYYFEFQSLPAASGTKAELKIYTDATTFGATGAIPSTASLWQLDGAYELFFSRMEAIIAKSADWSTCDEAPKRFGRIATHFEPLCVSATDRAP